jgi:uncharacterized protein
MTRLLVFKLIFGFITLSLLLFQIVIWKKITAKLARFRFLSSLRIVYFTMVACGQSVLWFGLFYPGRGINVTFPEWYQPLHRIFLAINYSHFVWLLPLGLVWLVGMIVKRAANRFSGGQNTSSEQTDATDIGRGDFLRKLAGAAATGINFLPAATSAVAISGMFLGSRDIWLNPKSISIPNLHDDLKGLRLVQISDIHIGNLIGERYLNFTLGLIRQARPDYILVTGDIIDNNNAFLPIAATFFALLDSICPGNVLAILGNHDYIDHGDAAAAAFTSAGVHVLRNEVIQAKRGRGRLQFGGLDYPPFGRSRKIAMQEYYARTRKQLVEGRPTVLLNHHPSDFEYLKTQPIDLILSGHTHGGQINFSENRNSILNGASWGYKYYVDLYEESGSQLYVNRGLGHWFPLRISCPPEITIFTLT